MSEWMDEYRATDDLNERYKILREELTRVRNEAVTELRNEAGVDLRYDRDAVAETLSSLDRTLTGDLIAFVANDFGLPVAFRPEGRSREVQEEVRRAILDSKYDDEQDDLDELRQELLEAHPEIHKAILVAVEDGDVRYHLPEGSNETTNFVTVREMVGLVDWTTNSYQSEGLSETY